MALTKHRIAEQIQNELGFPKNQSVEITETLLEIIKSSLASGEDVLVAGFGKFCLKEKAARKGRNPATGETIQIPAKTVVKFRVAKACKEAVLNA